MLNVSLMLCCALVVHPRGLRRFAVPGAHVATFWAYYCQTQQSAVSAVGSTQQSTGEHLAQMLQMEALCYPPSEMAPSFLAASPSAAVLALLVPSYCEIQVLDGVIQLVVLLVKRTNDSSDRRR
jgi:hypothetical protein